jgi:wobble nucleotide-excising tRNase
MLSAKNIDDIILEKIDELSTENKKELLRYIESLKTKGVKKTVEILSRTAGAWKNLVDAEELLKNIYADRLISTRPKVAL